MDADILSLTEQLKNPNFRIRIKAVRELCKYKDEHGISSLIDTFQDSNIMVRTEAINSLVKIGEPTIQPLIDALYSREKKIRDMAIITLGRIGDSAVQLLITRIIEEYPKYRREVDRALIKIGKLAINPLKESLLKEIFPDKNRVLRIINEIERPKDYRGDIEHSFNSSNLDKTFLLKLINNNILSIETFKNIIEYKDEDFKISLINSIQEDNVNAVPFLTIMIDNKNDIFKDLIKSVLIEMGGLPRIRISVLSELYKVKKHVNEKVNKDIDEVINKISKGEMM